jgi:hypothetical protein
MNNFLGRLVHRTLDNSPNIRPRSSSPFERTDHPSTAGGEDTIPGDVGWVSHISSKSQVDTMDTVKQQSPDYNSSQVNMPRHNPDHELSEGKEVDNSWLSNIPIPQPSPFAIERDDTTHTFSPLADLSHINDKNTAPVEPPILENTVSSILVSPDAHASREKKNKFETMQHRENSAMNVKQLPGNTDFSRFPGQRQESPIPPTIHVTIGRVEVRAVSQPRKAEKQSAPTEPKLSLEKYLSRREGHKS